MIKIEVFYFEGCPNHVPTLERLREVLAEENVTADIFDINVSDETMAQRVGFLGSPTIRVNGVDIEPTASAGKPTMTCRAYLDQGTLQGIPPRKLIQTAIRKSSAQ